MLTPEAKKKILEYVMPRGGRHKGLYEDCFEETFGEEAEYSDELQDEVSDFLEAALDCLCEMIDKEELSHSNFTRLVDS